MTALPRFCRHNSTYAKCPVCSRELEQEQETRTRSREGDSGDSAGGPTRRPPLWRVGTGVSDPERHAQHPNNILNRIVVPVRDEANRLLAEREQEPIERLTPHTLRRTLASILAVCEVHPRRARR